MSGQDETSGSSGPTEFHGLTWEYHGPGAMKAMQEKDPKEWEKLVIGICNMCQWDSWRLRGTGYSNNHHTGWSELERTFKLSDVEEKHMRYNPELDIDKATAFLFEWQEKQFQLRKIKGWTTRDGVRLRGHLINAEPPPEAIPTDQDPSEFIQDILADAFSNWSKGHKAAGLKAAIEKIPNPERVKRVVTVVCVGLGLIAPGVIDLDTDKYILMKRPPTCIAQHVAALAIVKQLQKITSQKVELYTADPNYGPYHKKALETLDQVESIGISFKVCDPAYGKQEHFTKIDESSLVFSVGAFCPIMRIVSEYTRPVAMIWECIEEHEDPKPANLMEPAPEVVWYEVNPWEVEGGEDYPKEAVQVPGTASFGGYSKRMVDMLRHEYYVEEAFPRYKPDEKVPSSFDLLDHVEHWVDPHGRYWNNDVRMYVRKRID